ncbi:hypothetical protein JCM5350_008174 [Sporobolomyces pararoseus]
MSFHVVVLLSILLNLIQSISSSSVPVTFITTPIPPEPLDDALPTKTLHVKSTSRTESLASPTTAPLVPRGYFDDDSADSWWNPSTTSSDDTSSSDSTSTDSSNSFAYSYSQSSNSTYCHESYEEYCRRNEISQGDGNGEKRKKWEKWMRKNCWNWSDSNAGGGGGGSDNGTSEGVHRVSFVLMIVLLSCAFML